MKNKVRNSLSTILLSGAVIVGANFLSVNEACGQSTQQIQLTGQDMRKTTTAQADKEFSRVEDSFNAIDLDSTVLNKMFFSNIMRIGGFGLRLDHRFKSTNIGIYSSVIAGNYNFYAQYPFQNYKINDLSVSLGAIHYFKKDNDGIIGYLMAGVVYNNYNKKFYINENPWITQNAALVEKGFNPFSFEIGGGFSVGRYSWGLRFDKIKDRVDVDFGYVMGRHYSKNSRRGDRNK